MKIIENNDTIVPCNQLMVWTRLHKRLIASLPQQGKEQNFCNILLLHINLWLARSLVELTCNPERPSSRGRDRPGLLLETPCLSIAVELEREQRR